MKDSSKGSFFTSVVLTAFFAGIGIFLVIKVISSITTYKEQNYQHMLTDMQAIARAATEYQKDYGSFPPDPRDTGNDSNSAPPELIPQYLSSWPQPPCQNWHYEWANPANGSPAVILNSTTQSLYHLCLDSSDDATCAHDVLGPATTSITSIQDKKIDCTTIILK